MRFQTVLERDHDAEINAVGVGPAVTSGGAGVAITSVYEDEKWNFVIQSQERGVESVVVDKALWARADKGTRVTLTPIIIGQWFGGELDLLRFSESPVLYNRHGPCPAADT